MRGRGRRSRFGRSWPRDCRWAGARPKGYARRGRGRVDRLRRSARSERAASMLPPSAPTELHFSPLRPVRPAGPRAFGSPTKACCGAYGRRSGTGRRRSSEVGLVAVPLFHKNAMRGTIKPVLYAGAKAVIMPQFEPRSFLQAAARYQVTFTGGVPAIFAMLLQHRDLIEELDLSNLKAFAIGSAVVPQETHRLPRARLSRRQGQRKLRIDRGWRAAPRAGVRTQGSARQLRCGDRRL